MNVNVISFCLPKAGNKPSECEDSLFPKNQGDISNGVMKFAIADGASEGMLSGRWAEILVKTYCRDNDSNFENILLRAYNKWDLYIKSYIHSREVHNRPIQWYEEHGLRVGAFSSLLGLTIKEVKGSSGGKWEAAAIGDSCLFQVRQRDVICRFPIRTSDEFSSRPLLVSSNPKNNKDLMIENMKYNGNWQIDDVFYLMTDALALWFMQQYESGKKPWDVLGNFNTIDETQSFRDWIMELRDCKAIRNDDVTFVRITI